MTNFSIYNIHQIHQNPPNIVLQSIEYYGLQTVDAQQINLFQPAVSHMLHIFTMKGKVKLIFTWSLKVKVPDSHGGLWNGILTFWHQIKLFFNFNSFVEKTYVFLHTVSKLLRIHVEGMCFKKCWFLSETKNKSSR